MQMKSPCMKIIFLPRHDFFGPEMFLVNWAGHNLMHEIFTYENLNAKLSFSCMKTSFSLMEILFLWMVILLSCMKMECPCMKHSYHGFFIHDTFRTGDQHNGVKPGLHYDGGWWRLVAIGRSPWTAMNRRVKRAVPYDYRQIAMSIAMNRRAWRKFWTVQNFRHARRFIEKRVASLTLPSRIVLAPPALVRPSVINRHETPFTAAVGRFWLYAEAVLPVFSKFIFSDCGAQKNSTNVQDSLFSVCFICVETFFSVLVAKFTSKLRISPGFINQQWKKPFSRFFQSRQFYSKMTIIRNKLWWYRRVAKSLKEL